MESSASSRPPHSEALPGRPSDHPPGSADAGAQRPSQRPGTGHSVRPPEGSLKPWRVLATAFDAVVRSSRMPAASQLVVAERFLGLWRAQGEPWLVIDSAKLLVDGEVSLVYATDEGVWLLPAFMAGLHAFRPRPFAHAEEVRRFAEELGDLHPDLNAINKLHSWLWSEGAEGFELDLQSSFMEADDRQLADSIVDRQRARVVRSNALPAFGPNAVNVASCELDAAAIRDEFQAPLEFFVESTGRAALADDDGDLAALGAQVEDPTRWAAAQVEAVLARPELRGAMPAQRLARQLLLLLAERADPRVLDYVNRLADRHDPYSQALSLALDDSDIGTSVSSRIETTSANAPVMARFLSVAPPKVARSLARGLLERADASPESGLWVTSVVVQFGLARFIAQLEIKTLPERAVQVLAGIVAGAQGTTEVLRDLLRQLPAAQGIALLHGLPEASFWRLQDEIERLLASEEPETIAGLVQRLIDSERNDAARILGTTLLVSGGRGWNGKMLPPTCQFIARLGMAREFLVPLARNPRFESRVRLFALRCLSDPDDQRVAVAWRFGELLDPPEVRGRLKEIRGQLKHGDAAPGSVS